MKSFWLALSFLTRLPAPASQHVEQADLARATRWYPLVGVVVGLVQVAAFVVGTWAVAPLFGAVLAVAAGEWFTRGLHLDGFADCLDGLLVNGDSARRLAVMKDPHVGGLGAAGVAIWVLLRVAAVQAAAENGAVVAALVGGSVISRSVIAADIVLFQAATPTGLYATLRGNVNRWDAGIAGMVGLLAVVALVWYSPVEGAVAAAGVLLLPLVWHRMWTGKLGGINGDVVGAAVQIRELWVWVCL